ncbi:MAG: SDR family NAD(P)-dependent oxidoreductase [Spongiibacteraceae bacterium]
MRELSGRVALITGGANGIGLALAEALASEGMHIALADIEETALENAQQRIAAMGVQCITAKTDVSRPDQIAALARNVVEKLGAVHVLCSNAGVTGPVGDPLWELDFKEWQRAFAINTEAALHAIQHFVPHMLKLDEAHIVVTASIAGLVPSPIIPQYHASKHALVSLTETLRHQLGRHAPQIGVSMVCPGAVDTQIMAREMSRHPTEKAGPARSDIPDDLYSDMVQPSDVAKAIVHAIRNRVFRVYPNRDSRQRIQERFAELLAE